MEQSRSQRTKVSMNHGLAIGVVFIVFSFLSGLAGKGAGSLISFLQIAILIGALYYSMKSWRDQYCDGYISYSKALGYGITTMFFASIIFAFYTVIYSNWINPGIVDENLASIEEGYYLMGFSDIQIEQFMDIAVKMQTPVWQMFTTIFGTTFTGLIISLIVALFVRKDGDPFQTAMNKIKETEEQENQ